MFLLLYLDGKLELREYSTIHDQFLTFIQVGIGITFYLRLVELEQIPALDMIGHKFRQFLKKFFELIRRGII